MPSSPLPVSVLFAAILALAQVPITVAVGLRRAHTNIQFLDGNDVRLLRLMRAHGNFVETVPTALIAMAAAEAAGLPRSLVAAGGAALVIGRALHYSTILSSGFGLGRAAGMVLTLLSTAAFAGYALVRWIC
ncbi:MAG TPA: MAPEG family protein [Labilithrix sp.]|nr:MAPEG family protein [Labilithrix sp.]